MSDLVDLEEAPTTEGKQWAVVDCATCARPLFFPSDWRVVEHICLRCREQVRRERP